jgi:hypothetical protein
LQQRWVNKHNASAHLDSQTSASPALCQPDQILQGRFWTGFGCKLPTLTRTRSPLQLPPASLTCSEISRQSASRASCGGIKTSHSACRCNRRRLVRCLLRSQRARAFETACVTRLTSLQMLHMARRGMQPEQTGRETDCCFINCRLHGCSWTPAASMNRRSVELRTGSGSRYGKRWLKYAFRRGPP